VNVGPKAASCHFKDRQRNGEAKAPRPGTSGIEIEHPVNGLDLRPVRVAGNDYVNPARHRVQTQFVDIVQHKDDVPAESHHLGVRIFIRPLRGVANIAAVDDMRNAREPLLCLRAQEAVGIRNNSNTEHSASVLSMA
jgi:hypothetical protein